MRDKPLVVNVTPDLRRMRYLILIIILFAPTLALAQTDEPLPDLTPREFEIRGELQVSLPDLQRQPLEGFAPPPRTYIVPADRQPYVAAYGHDFSGLPYNPLATPEPPTMLRSQPRTGQIDMLAGRYLSRIGRLTINSGGFGMNVGYSGFTGFKPRPVTASDYPLDANNVQGSIGYTTGNNLIFSVAVDGRYDNFGFLSPEENLEFSQAISSFGISTRLEGIADQSGSTGFEVIALARTNKADQTSIPQISLQESSVRENSEYLLSLQGSITPGVIKIDAGTTYLSGENVFMLASPLIDPTPQLEPYTVTSFYGGASAHLPLIRRQAATLGVQLMGYSASTEDDVQLYVAPIVHAELITPHGIRLFATNSPEVRDISQNDVWRTNPYIHGMTTPVPEVRIGNAQAGLEIQNQFVRFKAYGLGRYTANTLFFQKRQPLPNALQIDYFYWNDYHSTTQFGGGADFTVYLGQSSISLGGEFRSTRFVNPDDANLPQSEVPYIAPLIGNATVAVPFDGTRGLIQSTLYLESKRPTFETEKAPAWANFSIEAHYRLAGRFALIARGDNLTGSAGRWPGFPRPPAIISGGIRAGW